MGDTYRLEDLKSIIELTLFQKERKFMPECLNANLDLIKFKNVAAIHPKMLFVFMII